MSPLEDRGLQQERTVLAWDRTALALIVTAAFLFRQAGSPLLHVHNLVPAAATVMGLVFLLLDRPRYLARERRLAAGASILSRRAPVVMGSATTLLGLASLASVLG